MTFYERLEEILHEKNIKKAQLEKDLGITKSHMQSWRNGADPTTKFIIKLSEYLGVSADALLGLPNRQKEAEAPPDEETENIREIVALSKQLPEREQVKFIGKLEDAVNNLILGA